MTQHIRKVADGVLFVRTIMANLYIIREGASWVLIDAGLRGHHERIASAAREFVETENPPAAIVLTHGHFDHVGSLEALLETWNVPVFAHDLEHPYLNGMSPYPPPDPLAGGGSMAWLSRVYPRGPVDISSRLLQLADGGSLPGLTEWRWIHTPGHTGGHISLFRERDRTLIAGDALITTKQESMIAVATQRKEIHGPPSYFTQDWIAAARSVRALADLEPEALLTGHGDPMYGAAMRQELRDLATHFEDYEVPRFGRYAKSPAVTDTRGIVMLPPDPLPGVLAAAAVAGVAVWAASRTIRRQKEAA
jgi:glyoxylase-like metal-dependent hydrolase (beta-lactamase superfamily II)